MKNQKIINLFITSIALILPTMLFANTQGKTPPTTEEESKKLTVPQKVDKESARVIDQVEQGAHDIASTFKKKRYKNKIKF